MKITTYITCEKCRYDLYQLDTRSKCPECGLRIAETLTTIDERLRDLLTWMNLLHHFFMITLAGGVLLNVWYFLIPDYRDKTLLIVAARVGFIFVVIIAAAACFAELNRSVQSNAQRGIFFLRCLPISLWQ